MKEHLYCALIFPFHYGERCAVNSCKNKPDKEDKGFISYHRFPDSKHHLEKQKLWSSSIGKEFYKPRDGVICSTHFRSEHFKGDGKKIT